MTTIVLEQTNTPCRAAVPIPSNTKEAASGKPVLNVTYTTVSGPTVATPASATPNPVTTGTTTSVSVLGADPAGEASLTYTWSATGPASVAFSPNGTNGAKASTATFNTTGAYTLTATITDASALSTTSSVNVNYTPGPTVATPASANPNPVTSGLTTSVSVLGADPAGEASLTYTWSATGPASVAFSPNGTNGAKASTATFTATGAYTLTATITDAAAHSITSSVNVTVSSSGGTTAALPTVADTYVQQGTPTTNYGTATTMLVKNVSGGTTTRYTFLKFDLTSITGPVSNATMTLSGVSTNTTADTVAAFGDTGTTWTETGLTYGNMPAIGSALSSTVSVSGGTLTPYTWSGLASYIDAHRGGLVTIVG